MTLTRTRLANAFDAVTAATAATGALLLCSAWDRLPEPVATHFDVMGRPNAWGPKWTLAVLPASVAGVLLLFRFLGRFPKLFNYPWKLTEEERNRSHPIACEMLSCFAMILAFGFVALEWQCIEVNLEPGRRLSAAWLVAFLGAIPAVLAVYFVRLWKSRGPGPGAPSL